MPPLPELPERQRARQGNGQTHTSRSGHTSTSGFTPSKIGSSESPVSVSFGDLNNLLRLRTKFEFTRLSSRLPKRLVGHVGADLNLQQQSITPAVKLQYEVQYYLLAGSCTCSATL